jgi:rubrerythrin
MALEKILETSSRVRTDDLDWEAAGRAGLAPHERLVLGYFADIESQTVMYLRELLRSSVAEDPEAQGFLSVWNYEEYFHGEALAKVLAAAGHPLPSDRVARLRRGAAPLEVLQGALAWLASRAFPEPFAALYLLWGASQELTTLRGYQELERRTRNPVLAELCRRIARQERRHFAWYFNGARERLAASPGGRRLARWALRRFWAPVGGAVKGDRAALEVGEALFPGEGLDEVARAVEGRIGSLPGLGGLLFFTGYLRRARRRPAAYRYILRNTSPVVKSPDAFPPGAALDAE